MKSKATAKEMVGTKIVYAMLLVCFYWMWARRDWHNYYDSIQNAIFMFSCLYFLFQARRFYQYRKEEKDREAIQILHRIDAIGCGYIHRWNRGGLCARWNNIRIHYPALYSVLRNVQKRNLMKSLSETTVLSNQSRRFLWQLQ